VGGGGGGGHLGSLLPVKENNLYEFMGNVVVITVLTNIPCKRSSPNSVTV